MAIPRSKYGNSSNSKNAKEKAKPPIVIRKVKKVQAAKHHGGMWKVAYADFVTAMMAFFLLLWLLSTSSKATLEGIAEYFTPVTGIENARPIGINRVSPTLINRENPGINMSQPGPIQGQAGRVAGSPETPSPEEVEEMDNLFAEGATALTQAIARDESLSSYQENIQIGQTPEGLKIELRDSAKYPMFVAGSAMLTQHGAAILMGITPLIKRMPNYLAITGYTDGSARDSDADPYANWTLSTNRAQSALKFMVKSGLETQRTQRLTGVADNQLLLQNEPRSPKNRRITLMMLKGSHILIPQSAVPETASP
jgi:chemotaxis protein MotB